MNNRIKKSIELRKLLLENLGQFERLTHEIADNDADKEFRGVKMDFLCEIYKKYDEQQVLNADGDIFYIKSVSSGQYIGQRILWNLELSNELYIITKTPIYDIDGEFEYYKYDVEVAE